jgi:hypothetical protein
VAVDIGFDESGSHDILLLAAQVGLVQKSRKLKTVWKSILGDSRVPFFHSVDYDNFSKGVFCHLSREERTLLLQSLCGHLRKRMLFGITGKITISNYNSKTNNAFRSQWAAAYSFAMQMLMLGVRLQLERLQLGYDVNILLEDGHKNAGQAINILRKIKLANKRNPGDVALNIMTEGLGSKINNPILQAADMLGYSEWQRLTQGNREIYDQLHVKGSRYFWVYMDIDKRLLDSGLEVANTSDEAKAILKKADWHKKTGSREGLDETFQRIREFQRKHEKTDDSTVQRRQSQTGRRGESREREKAEG